MRKLPKSELMHLAEILEMVEIKKNDQIRFTKNNKSEIYFIKKGTVKICDYSNDGEEDIKCILGPGHLFGETALFENDVDNEVAVTLDECILCVIDLPQMRGIMERNPVLKTSIYKLMGLRIRKLERRLESILFKDSKTRILEFLTDMSNDYGENEGDYIILKNFLTHGDIAKMTATSRQTVTSILNELRTEGIIDYDKDRYIFLKTEPSLKKTE